MDVGTDEVGGINDINLCMMAPFPEVEIPGIEVGLFYWGDDRITFGHLGLM